MDGLVAGEAMRPLPFELIREARELAAVSTPGDLLQLCAARIGMLIGRPQTSEDPRMTSLADYASSALYTETERVALEFTEQYALDVAAMPDDLVADLQDKLGPEGLFGFVLGLYAVDQSERLALTAGIHPNIGAPL